MYLYDLKTKIKHLPVLGSCCSALLKHPYLCAWAHPLLNRLGIDDFSRTVEAEKSRLFFAQNQEKVQQVLALLSDKKSKKVLKDQISYRSGGPAFPIGTPDDQYFPKDVIHLSQQEVLVDCGAYTGDTILKFQKLCHNRYRQIIAFEASPRNFEKLQKQNFARCKCLSLAAWDCDTLLPFLCDEQKDDRIAHLSMQTTSTATKKQISVPAKALDHIPACAEMTFLKMDIEGAEMKALQGARQTILKQHPTLAISVYHSDSDLLDIGLWINELGLPYKHYMRLHAYPNIDVVWYAVPIR